MDCSMAAVWRLLHRHGWSWQSSARRALEGDEHAVELWEGCVAAGGMTAAALGAFVVLEDEAGFSMTPPRARTWGRRGHTPVVRVRGRSWRRWAFAALCCAVTERTVQYRLHRRRASRTHPAPGPAPYFSSDRTLSTAASPAPDSPSPTTRQQSGEISN
ncbi:winged helix-turn-helix domain-containing protein [Streptomyces sp. NPDC051001]|uniref:winged helix-turn-helix domain-containing protein n=1 Tax=Streptomyces sp. NPDC051001 TaxID=3155795 RepID=UPI00341E12D7